MHDFFKLLCVQFALTWTMVGIIWFVQIVHYPLYWQVREGFTRYERKHLRKAACLVAPVMLLEAISGVLLIGAAEDASMVRLSLINIILLLLIWLSTFLFQMQQHQKLSLHFSKKMVATLIYSNWIRTVLWTVKGGILFAMLFFYKKW